MSRSPSPASPGAWRVTTACVVVVAALAGCLGGGHPTQGKSTGNGALVPESPSTDPPVGLGGVHGNVSDAELLPIPDVEVRLTGPSNQTLRTNAAGQFAFANLEPGKYVLTFNKKLFFNETRKVDVLLEKYTSLGGIVLRPRPDDTPFHAAVSPCAGYIVVDADGSQPGGTLDPNQNNKCRIAASLGFGGFVGVLRWQGSGAFGQRLQAAVYLDGLATATYFRGPNPLIIRYSTEPNRTHSRVDVTITTDTAFTANPYPPVAFQQHYDLYPTVFYNMKPPGDYPGDAP